MIEVVSKGLRLGITDVEFGFPIFEAMVQDGSGFGRQPEVELKQEEDTAQSISRVETENLEARVLSHNLSSSWLEREVTAETYQGTVDPIYTKVHPLSQGLSASSVTDISPKIYTYTKPTPILPSIDSTGNITYVHYVGSAQAGVLYITGPLYESYQSRGEVEYNHNFSTREYQGRPYFGLIQNQQQFSPDNRYDLLSYGIFTPRMTVTDYRTVMPAQQGDYGLSETDISSTKTGNIEVMGFADLVNLRVKDAMPHVVKEGEPDVEIVAPELRALDGSQTRPDETDYLSNVRPLEPNYILTAFMPEIVGTELTGVTPIVNDVLRAEDDQETYQIIRVITPDYLLPRLSPNALPEFVVRGVLRVVGQDIRVNGRIRTQDMQEFYDPGAFVPDEVKLQAVSEVPSIVSDVTYVSEVRMDDIFKGGIPTRSDKTLRAEDSYSQRASTLDGIGVDRTSVVVPLLADSDYVLPAQNADVLSRVRDSDVFNRFLPPAQGYIQSHGDSHNNRFTNLPITQEREESYKQDFQELFRQEKQERRNPYNLRRFSLDGIKLQENSTLVSVADNDSTIQPTHYRPNTVDTPTNQGIVEVKWAANLGFDGPTLRDGFKDLSKYRPDSQEVITLTNQPSRSVTQSSFLTQDYFQVVSGNNGDFRVDNITNGVHIQPIERLIHQPYTSNEYSENILTNTNITANPKVSSVEQSHLDQLLQADNYQDSDSQNRVGPISRISSAIEPATQPAHQEDAGSRSSDLDYNYTTALNDFEPPAKKQDEPLEPQRKSELCYTKPRLNGFVGFEGAKKEDFYGQEKTKQACPVKPKPKEIKDASFEKHTAQNLEDKVELEVCPVRPDLKERFYVESDTQVKWFSLFDAPVDITSKLIDNDGAYALRVKGKDTDFERPFYESRSATYVTQANSGIAIVDKLIRQLGLNPVWEVEQEITDDEEISSGKVYLKDIMGIKEATKELLEAHVGGIDFVIRFYDKKTGEVELRALEDVLSMGDVESERYKIDIVAQARVTESLVSQTKRQFKEEISEGYETPVLEEIVYREGLKREEPLSGTGGIDEFIPGAGDIYEVVIASQGVYDRESRDIKGAFSVLKFKVSDGDLADDSNYVMAVKDKNGFDKLYRTKANNLSAILDRKLKEHNLKGVFVEIDTHKDGEEEAYKVGGELNNTTIYLAGVEGAMTKFLEENHDVSPHQMGILIEKLKYPCGGASFGKYHNPDIYNQKRMEEQKKAA